MALDDYAGDTLLSFHSVSETARFGYRTDRVTVGSDAVDKLGSSEALADAVGRAIAESTASIMILRYPSQFVSLVGSLRLSGVRVLPAGTLLYWEAPTLGAETVDPRTSEILPADRADAVRAVSEVLGDSFAGYVNHYAANPLLDSGVVVAGYQEWALSTMTDPANRVFAVADATALAGVAIVSVSDRVWEVELASVVTASQGKGYYLALMGRVMAEATAAGVRLVISTQSHNIAVQRAWTKLGFRPIASVETVHIVDESLLSAVR